MGGHLEQREIIDISAGVLRGLDYMHKRNAIHRDIKPENIMFDADGFVKIVDFGFARVMPPLHSIADGMSICGAPIRCTLPSLRWTTDKMSSCGTPLYCAPEVLT